MFSAETMAHQGWDSLTSYDVVFVACALSISALTALGAVMNGRWAEAKAPEKT